MKNTLTAALLSLLCSCSVFDFEQYKRNVIHAYDAMAPATDDERAIVVALVVNRARDPDSIRTEFVGSYEWDGYRLVVP